VDLKVCNLKGIQLQPGEKPPSATSLTERQSYSDLPYNRQGSKCCSKCFSKVKILH